jgi:hypothetical protein
MHKHTAYDIVGNFEYKDINIQVNIWGFIKKKVEGLFEIKEVKDDK